jgi:hypothetical protein
LPHVDGLTIRRAADAFEAMRHPFEPFEIALHVFERARGELIGLALPQELDPSAQRRQRRPQLMRRFARHPGPHPLAVGVRPRAEDVQRREQDDAEHPRLQDRHDAELLHQWRVPEVHRTDVGLAHRLVLFVELADPLRESRIVRLERRIGAEEREVGGGGWAAGRIGDDDGHAGTPDVLREVEERADRIAPRVGERAIDLRVHLPFAPGLRAQAGDDALGEEDVRPQEERHDHADDDRGAAPHP